MRYNTVDTCINRVRKYLVSDNFSQPFFINTENRDEYLEVKERLSIGLSAVCVSSFCRTEDDAPHIDELLETITTSTNNSLLIGYTYYLKLQGEKMFRRYIEKLCSMSIKGKVVVLCFQSEVVLKNILDNDLRIERRISFLQESASKAPEITLINNSLRLPNVMESSNGFRGLLQKAETSCPLSLSVYTSRKKAEYKKSLITIHEINAAFDALLKFDPSISDLLNRDCGTEAQWFFLLNELASKQSFDAVFKSLIKVSDHFELLFHNWDEFSNEQRWLFFIALKIKGTSSDYVNTSVQKANNISELIKNLYRGILNVQHNSSKFMSVYVERKSIIKEFKNSIDELIDFCQYAEIKGANKIYYLTDNTYVEKFAIVECLSKYEYSYEQIESILSYVYPDLASYLLPFRFDKPLLDEYFQPYKFQKLTNTIRDDFFDVVQNHAANREFNYELPYRSTRFDAIDKTDALLFFIDALGAEFLGFIIAKCKELNLQVNVSICHSNLPSITSINKEFLDGFDPAKVVIVKELDEIKHHGKENFDYQKTLYPIHVVRELEIINNVLKKAKNKLVSGTCNKVIIVSDHGASRLAVIREQTYTFDVDSKGTHGGRCCAYIPDLPKIEYATEENGYYVLASYDRFKGSRAASVETHGGATLEEVVVPIIELTQKPLDIEVRFINDTITVSFRKKAEIILFTKTKLNSVTLLVSGKYYDGEKLDDNHYKIMMPDIKRIGKYQADVYDGNNLLVTGLAFKVEKEGSKEKDLF